MGERVTFGIIYGTKVMVRKFNVLTKNDSRLPVNTCLKKLNHFHPAMKPCRNMKQKRIRYETNIQVEIFGNIFIAPD